MTRIRTLTFPVAALLAAWLLAPAVAAAHPPTTGPFTPIEDPDQIVCVSCLAAMEDERITPPVEEWKESVHFEAGVTCADCHGGNETDEALAMEPDEGWVGTPAKADVSKMCATCHGDARLMREYNQRSDQFLLYSGSKHGRLRLEGDEGAPACTDCHGKHRILRVKDPKAIVNRRNVSGTCGDCHANQEIFKDRGVPTDALTKYHQSFHYEQLEQGNMLVPTCVDCHSNHGILSPKAERVQTVCFNCHAAQADYYKAGPHYKVWKEQGEPICLTCHNNHDITRPSVAKFTGSGPNDCVMCHYEDDPAYQTGVKIAETVGAAVTAVEAAQEGLRHLEEDGHGGFEVTDLKKAIDGAAEGLGELHTLTHKMDVEAVRASAEKLVKTANAVSSQVDYFWDEIKIRKIGLVFAWAIFMGLAWVLWTWSKMVERERDRD